MEQNKTPLRIYCKNCGAPAGFDIIHQTYRCTSCGGETGIGEAKKSALNWQQMKKKQTAADMGASGAEELSCPSCGAHIFFKAGEASESCAYCGTKLVRSDMTDPDKLPELIIPFYITYDEARKRMLDWGHKHENTPEGQSVVSSMGNFKGAYLPYRLVKGPVSAEVCRDGTERKYHCRGYLEGIAVSAGSEADNMVLNDIEPFDWSEAKEFDYGYIAGQNVKLATLSDKNIAANVCRETEQAFLPMVEKVLQTKGVDIRAETGDMMSLSALLPIYYMRSGDLTAVMNGQTGRIAVSKKREKKIKYYMLEPLIYTVIMTVIFGIWGGAELAFYAGMVFGCIFFAALTDGKGPITRSITLKSENAKAHRENDELKISESKNILKNPFDITPVFYEKNRDGAEVPVKIRFYNFTRCVYMIFRSLITVFLPAVLAAFFRLIMISGTNERFADKFNIGYGAAWYVLGFMIFIIYFVKQARNNVFEIPIIYELREGKPPHRITKNVCKGLSVLSMFGIGVPDKDGKVTTLFGALRDMGGMGCGLGCILFFILLGSTAAIIS
ncbi:MAG: hypothetical protein IKS17_02660 [Firmicutes bacterium]|nr:hypothetical protein [Bacillota bacterium]